MAEGNFDGVGIDNGDIGQHEPSIDKKFITARGKLPDVKSVPLSDVEAIRNPKGFSSFGKNQRVDNQTYANYFFERGMFPDWMTTELATYNDLLTIVGMQNRGEIPDGTTIDLSVDPEEHANIIFSRDITDTITVTQVLTPVIAEWDDRPIYEKDKVRAKNIFVIDKVSQQAVDVARFIDNPDIKFLYDVTSRSKTMEPGESDDLEERHMQHSHAKVSFQEITYGDIKNIEDIFVLTHEIGHLLYENNNPLTETEESAIDAIKTAAKNRKLDSVPLDTYSQGRTALLFMEQGASVYGLAMINKMKSLGVNLYPENQQESDIAAVASKSFASYKHQYPQLSEGVPIGLSEEDTIGMLNLQL